MKTKISSEFRRIIDMLKGFLVYSAVSRVASILIDRFDAFLLGDEVMHAELIGDKLTICSAKGIFGDRRKVKLYFKNSNKPEIVEPIESIECMFSTFIAKQVYKFRWELMKMDENFKVFKGENGLRDIVVRKSGIVVFEGKGS